MLGFALGLSTLGAIVMALGPKAVFYWAHTKIFPAGHQWFFYYEESLMTTLMKAPDIFAFIALLLVAVLIALWLLGFWGMHSLLNDAPVAASTTTANPMNNTKSKRKSRATTNNR